jgi:hypothetical protein
MSRITTGLLFTVLAAVAPPEAFALITGGEGNTPITDPGWPGGRPRSSTTRAGSPGGRARRKIALISYTEAGP